ncbi:hypothetical protein Ahy_A01g000067 [Arachis hypogaea]|uniref:Uncharacterized protein n=1 Tax=Arachis hypogaea TaxID=3818 RepID=A0A445EJ79_ARAHY|nr:hypothetical protein Ahy_A01g000067 [Arachis hypogaea]
MAVEVLNINGGSSASDSVLVVAQSLVDVTSCREENMLNESAVVTNFQTGNNGRNTCPGGNPPQSLLPVTVGWPPYGLPPGYTPPIGGFVSLIRFGSTVGENNFNHYNNIPKRIARIVDYDEGGRQNLEGNYEGFKNFLKNENEDARLGRKNPRVVCRGQNADDMLARLRANQENEVVKIATMGLGFYMRQKLLNIHILDLAHLAKRSKYFPRKEKVSYVAMEFSSEKSDFETKVDLIELKKRPPYVCSLFKKVSNVDKWSDLKHKNRKKYSFDILKSNQIFDVLLKDKQLVLPEGKMLLSIKDLKEKPYCKFHQTTSH